MGPAPEEVPVEAPAAPPQTEIKAETDPEPNKAAAEEDKAAPAAPLEAAAEGASQREAPAADQGAKKEVEAEEANTDGGAAAAVSEAAPAAVADAEAVEGGGILGPVVQELFERVQALPVDAKCSVRVSLIEVSVHLYPSAALPFLGTLPAQGVHPRHADLEGSREEVLMVTRDVIMAKRERGLPLRQS